MVELKSRSHTGAAPKDCGSGVIRAGMNVFDFEFRIGPKPKVITHGQDERLEHDHYIFDQSNNVENTYDVKRLGRAEYEAPDYPHDFNYDGKDRNSDRNNKYVPRPEELQLSPRYNNTSYYYGYFDDG